MKIIIIMLFIIFLRISTNAQVDGLSVGAALGFGNFKGKVISESGFSMNAFIEVSPDFWQIIDFRFDYTYMKKFEALFPDNNPERYYPSIQSYSIKVITRQELSEKWFLEEGVGPMILLDRTYSDINEWDYGISGWFAFGIDLQKVNNIALTISVGSQFGLTFTNTTASFINYSIQAQYFLIN